MKDPRWCVYSVRKEDEMATVKRKPMTKKAAPKKIAKKK